MLDVWFIKLALDSVLWAEILSFRFLVFLLVDCIFHRDIRFSCKLDITDLINSVALFLTVISIVLELKSRLSLRYVGVGEWREVTLS